SELRHAGTRSVIVLAADHYEGGNALDKGADDYVLEDALDADMAPRTRALMRRLHPPPRRQLEFDDVVIDLAAREVRVREEPIDLTPREFDLFAFLASEPRVVFSRSELLERVWGASPDWQSDATVTEHVRRLRQKVDEPSGRRLLRTVRGVGYSFRP